MNGHRFATFILIAATCTFSLLINCKEDRKPAWQAKMETLRWVDYSPTHANPEIGIEPSVDSVREDLAVLHKAGFTGLITYGAKGRLGTDLPTIASSAGFLGIIVGIWNPADAEEIAAAKRAAAPDIVVGICVGNEGLMEHRYSAESLEAAIKELRTDTKKPVTTTEIFERYDGKLADLVDWVFPNVHPYFSHVTEPLAAVSWTQNAFHQLTQQTSKFVMLKEVGLPTEGDLHQDLSEEAQCRYYEALAKTNVRFAYFEAFDQSWKKSLPVEPHWGIFRDDRGFKKVAKHLAGNAPCQAPSTSAATPAHPPKEPFYVYRDSGSSSNHFSPTGRMGDVGDIRIIDDWPTNPKSGTTCMKIEYLAKGSDPTCDYAGPCKWAGVYWQEPPGNRGTREEWRNSGYDLTGYGTLKFSARADWPSVVEFKVGGIVGPYGDSLRPARSVTAHLTPEWNEFTIDLSGADLKYIIGGFAWSASRERNPNGAIFYLDDVRFEPIPPARH